MTTVTFTKDFETITTENVDKFNGFEALQDYIIRKVNAFRVDGYITFDGKNVLRFVYSEHASEHICFLYESKKELDNFIKKF